MKQIFNHLYSCYMGNSDSWHDLELNIVINGFSQLKRLKLRKNNWDSDTYEFDELLTEFASQKRVYEVVAKPVVEVFTKTNLYA